MHALAPLERRRRSRWTFVAVSLRVFALFFAVELSGVAHGALDAAVAAGWLEHPHDDCDEEAGSHDDCPPGCLSCHCSHVALSAPAPHIEGPLHAVGAIPAEGGFVPRTEQAPRQTDLTRLYRPPRAVAAI